MTTHHVVTSGALTWIDVVAPSRLDLLDLARNHNLHHTVVEDCLDPDHLPKFERIDDATFVILRAHDDQAPDDAATIQELTRKVAIFFRKDLLLTVHRVDLHEIHELRQRYAGGAACTLPHLLAALGGATLGSYEKPLERAEAMLDRFETGLFDDEAPPSLKEAHDLKRRVSLMRRILWQSNQVYSKLVPSGPEENPLFQDIRETLEAYLFWADQLLEQAALLQQVQLSMASHRTNEVMRVLTVFSAFFLPLTFIVGVYGMNFRFMPELEATYGYYVIWGVMVAVVVGIGLWFKQKGWLG